MLYEREILGNHYRRLERGLSSYRAADRLAMERWTLDTHPPEISPWWLITGIARRSVAFEWTKAGAFRNDASAPNTFDLQLQNILKTHSSRLVMNLPVELGLKAPAMASKPNSSAASSQPDPESRARTAHRARYKRLVSRNHLHASALCRILDSLNSAAKRLAINLFPSWCLFWSANRKEKRNLKFRSNLPHYEWITQGLADKKWKFFMQLSMATGEGAFPPPQFFLLVFLFQVTWPRHSTRVDQ